MVTDIVFDLDDTLCDFSAARRRGIDQAFTVLPERYRSDAQALWHALEPGLFKSFAAGEITRDEYRRRRFATILSELGLADVPGEEMGRRIDQMNRAFMREINDGAQLMPGAAACLAELRERGLSCHVLTNGPADSQRKRIRALGVDTFLEEVFVGEEIGAFKPDPIAFCHAVDRIGRRPDQAVMVGDDLHADVLAARQAGLHAIHYAPAGSGYTPHITHLNQLAHLIAQL